MVEIASMADITPSETAKEPNQISNEEDPVSILIVEDNVELRNFYQISCQKVIGYSPPPMDKKDWTKPGNIFPI